MLSWFGNLMARESRRQNPEPTPLLDALLPILEYSYDELKAGGFDDSFLTAAVKAYARIHRAAAELKPLGIYESDLNLLLQERMKERLKMQREKAGYSRRRRR
jgi:hypothetical protein